jgi:hydrogenase maturation protease
MKTLVLGMGNPILSDDGVGLLVARALEGEVPGVDVVTTEMVGLNVLDMLIGYDTVFLIDAATTKNGAVGDVHQLNEGSGSLHLFSSHGVNFPDLLQLGKEFGYKMPEVAAIYGIEISEEAFFGEGLSSELAAKLDGIIRTIRGQIMAILDNM